MTITVVIITKNEEEQIAQAIKSAKLLTDEILVFDSHSTDNTVKLAKNNGAKVVTAPFRNFADQRNKALKKVTSEWILYLDSDETITHQFADEVKKIIHSKNSYNGYFIKRDTYFYGKKWNFEDKVQRLFKKNKFKRWHGEVHETPEIEGDFGLVNSPIKHNTHRNIEQMVQKTNEWSETEATLRYNSNHPKMKPIRFIRVMLTAFLKSYIQEKGYKNGTEGLIEAIYQSFSMFVTYAKLWEKQIK